MDRECDPPMPTPALDLFAACSGAVDKFDQWADRFIPRGCSAAPELVRRARFITRFSFLGSCFGAFYAVFYLAIGHRYGAAIVMGCSVAFTLTPWFLRWTGSLAFSGNMLSVIMTGGFTGLGFVEGGVNGHAVAWLASVPLCALLLNGRKAAGWWAVTCLGAVGVMVGLSLAHVELAPQFDPAWNSLVSATGYLGLVGFMFVLGLVFETARERAFSRLQDALARLESSNKELLRLNQEKNDFLGIAAHDLRNPLTTIIGSAELLRLQPAPEKADRLSGNIIAAGSRMLQLIKDLLNTNAIEEGRYASQLEPCDLALLVQESVGHNLTAAVRKHIHLEFAADAPVWVQADRNAALQVLDNLISNAVKFSPPHRAVHLALTHDASAACAIVRDEGPGISEEDQKKLFRKFSRLTARPTGGESSTGLGLSIVKRLAEAMGGTIECRSVVGQGASFIFRLQAAPAAVPVAPASVPVEPILIEAR